MTTISTFAMRTQLLDSLISVDPTAQALQCHLEESWPSDLPAQKEELQTNIADAIDAEKIHDWKFASYKLHCCLAILITHKKSVPQELMFWLVMRICVPLGFISQFKFRDLELAFKALDFMLQFIWYEYDYKGKNLNLRQINCLECVEAMAASVAYEYAKSDAEEVKSVLHPSSQLYMASKRLATEECAQGDVKARCCELLCVQYNRLGEIGKVWEWLREWQRCVERITDSKKQKLQKRDCLLLEGSLCAENGADDKKVKELISDLDKLSRKLQEKANKVGLEEKPWYFKMSFQIQHVLMKLRLRDRSGDAGTPEMQYDQGQAQSNLIHMKAQSNYVKDVMEQMGLADRKVGNYTVLDLDRKVTRATDSAREEEAIRYLQVTVDHVKSNPFYTNNPSKLASALAELCFNQASCHERLFLQKELKFFIDSMEKNCSTSGEGSTSFSSASLKLCAHHCWSPYCHCDSHGCPEEDEDEEDEDEDEDDEELAALGRHELESPSEFYTKRHIESDGNNLVHLTTAIELLDEALNHADRAGNDVFNVVKVQSFLARTHLLVARSKCHRLVEYESWPLPAQLTPEFLVANNLYTIRQVREFLDRHDASPIKSFLLAHYHYRQCANMFTKHLDSLKNYSENWVHTIEKQKDLYVKLQNTLSVAFGFHMKLRDVLSQPENRPVEEVVRREAEYVEFMANMLPEAVLWSERGRARFLELQLNRTWVQQQAGQQEILKEQGDEDLSAFDFHDQVAWSFIRSSLDACGEGTVFLEYSTEGKSDWKAQENPLGRLYGIKKASGRILEPLVMENLSGDPMKLQSLIGHLHNSMDPESLPKYDDEAVTRDLEELYKLLIPPQVAELLKGMQPDHKLVICPSEIFTKVPFAALRNPAEPSREKGYMFQSHTISITPSLRTLTYNKERYTALQNLQLMDGQGASVAMGNPRYKDESKWPPLPESGAEVESIASLFSKRCEPLTSMAATVENLLDRARLPSERSRSQAFVHIAAHCATDDDTYKQGFLKLTDPDPSDMPSSSSTPPVGSDGILSAENVLKSGIEWRAHMVVLSACGSGKGEIKAEGVLNLPRAFMVAGVPCSVVSQWKVEDDSTARLMELFYQRMLKGVDVATALRSSMQEMLDNGSSIKQWAPFMVWGLPTVCLPDELLSEDASVVLLQLGKELIEPERYSDARLPLKKSLELMKAKGSHTEEETNALVRCLWWLADTENSGYRTAQSNEKECHSFPIPLKFLKYAIKSHICDLKAQQLRHLDSEVQYLNEALECAKDDGFSLDPPTKQVIHKRLGKIHHSRGELCFSQAQNNPVLPEVVGYGIQAVLDYHQTKGVSGEDSWRTAFEHLIECAKSSSRDMNGLLTNMLLLDMVEILRWRQGYLQLVKQQSISTSDDELAVLNCTQEFLFLMARIAEKEMWLHRMYTPPWEESALGWRAVPADGATWDSLKVDSWKETLTLPSDCGIDVAVEYVLDISDTSPQRFLYISVISQIRPPRFYVKEVNVDRLRSTASAMSLYNNFEFGNFRKDLEYLHGILIEPVLGDPIINSMDPTQMLVFIPCELLEGVPFALLRDGAQPEGEGYLIQSHTISTVPSFRILERCRHCHQDLQCLPLMPDASNASLVLSNPAILKDDMEARDSGPALIVDSQFPNQCTAFYGSVSAVEALLAWANFPISLTDEHCQAFFHMEADIGDELADEVELYGRGTEWRVRMAIVRACPSANGQMQKKIVLRLVKELLMQGVPSVVMSNSLVDDVSSDVFFTHLYTSLKQGEGVAAAVRYSMLEMKNEGFELDQWGAFPVVGHPTARLPQEMLQSNHELLETRYYSDLLIFPPS